MTDEERKAEFRRRMRDAQKVIMAFADYGRHCFKSTAHVFDRITTFHVDQYGQIWIVDGHTGMKLYPHGPGQWIGFTGGDIERELIEALRAYIADGTPAPRSTITDKRWKYPAAAIKGVISDLSTNPAIEPDTTERKAK